MVPQEILDLILCRLASYKKSGRQIKALCPFHSERNPSFYFDVELGIWHCFGCGRGGNLRELLINLYPDLAPLYVHKRDAQYERLVSFYESLPYLLNFEEIVAEIEKRRAIKADVLAKINPKWCPLDVNDGYEKFAGRIIFPCRYHNTLSTFVGYSLGWEQPKYLFPPNTKPLAPLGFTECYSEMLNAKCIYVVEGIFDMLSLWQLDLPAVATLGNAVSAIPTIIPDDVQIFLLPDNPKVDKGGLRFAIQWSISCILGGRWDARLAVFPSYYYKDCNDALVSNALEEQLEKIELYSIPQVLIHAAIKHPHLVSLDYVVSLLTTYLPSDYMMELVSWVKKRYPQVFLKFYLPLVGVDAADSKLQDETQRVWRILREAARTVEGRNILQLYFLEVEVPHLFSLEVVQEKCPIPKRDIIEACKVATRQIRGKAARQIKTQLATLGFIDNEPT